MSMNAKKIRKFVVIIVPAKTLSVLLNAFVRRKDTVTISQRAFVTTSMSVSQRKAPVERTWFVRIIQALTAVNVNRTTERMEMAVKVGALFLFVVNQWV